MDRRAVLHRAPDRSRCESRIRPAWPASAPARLSPRQASSGLRLRMSSSLVSSRASLRPRSSLRSTMNRRQSRIDERRQGRDEHRERLLPPPGGQVQPAEAGWPGSFRSVCPRDIDLPILVTTRHVHSPRIAADLAVLDERAFHVGLDIDLHLLAAEGTCDQEFVRHADECYCKPGPNADRRFAPRYNPWTGGSAAQSRSPPACAVIRFQASLLIANGRHPLSQVPSSVDCPPGHGRALPGTGG